MLVKRHLLMFFRDKANVFFSFLAILIILGLFALFLDDVMVQAIEAELGHSSETTRLAVGAMLLGGTVAVTSITSCLGALGISVGDKARAGKDFLTSPLSRSKISFSYILSSTLIGLIMTGLTLVLVVAYLMFQGADFPGWATWGKLLLTLVLSVVCANSMMYFITLFVNSRNALSALGSIIGTMVGFLMGIYLPIGQFPSGVQWVIRLFPLSHAASMFRQVLADAPLADLFASAPPEALETLREFNGITFRFGDLMTGFWFSAAVLLVTTVVFYGLSLLVLKFRKTV